MAIDDDTESCSSRRIDSLPPKQQQQPRRQLQKLEVYNDVLRRIQEFNYEETDLPGFDDQLWLHFNRLPVRYALDVNVERAEDVLTHKKLLRLAEDPANRPVFLVRPVQVHPSSYGNLADDDHSDSPNREDAESFPTDTGRHGTHPPPAFGSSTNLEALAHANGSHFDDGDCTLNSTSNFSRPMHEITISTTDRPKLLSQLTTLIGEVGLNIQECHAFSTVDGFSLDVFVVDGWPYEEIEDLRDALEDGLSKIEDKPWMKRHLTSVVGKHGQTGIVALSDHLNIPTDGSDVWEIDSRQLKIDSKVASGTYGDLYKGTYFSQEVAIKVLKPDHLNADILKDFAQEVYVMRKIRHKNVVHFLGACTQPPNLCIITEFMSRGSLHDFLHKRKGVFKLPSVLKIAIDVSKGMNYLHQNSIIHRDLKTANLLMDENEVVKVADFGVARVQSQSGVMTAETGTYRWMAPEEKKTLYVDYQYCVLDLVIGHSAYDHKADVFSFGIVLWELLTGEIPYSHLSPLQAAVGVVQKSLRPKIPNHTLPRLVELLERCWQQEPSLRPNFSEVLDSLQQITSEATHEREDVKDKIMGVLLSGVKQEAQV